MANTFLTNYNISAFIGTAYATEVWTYAQLGEGLDNVAESLNEIVQQYQYLNGGGFAKNHVTGMAPAWTFSGIRVMGDAAQDYIFSKKYSLGSDRASSFKITYVDDSEATVTLTVPCTICSIQEISGAATDDSAISFEIRFDEAPTIS